MALEVACSNHVAHPIRKQADMKKIFILFIIVILLLTGCSGPVESPDTMQPILLDSAPPFLVVGKLDVYTPSQSIHIPEAVKIRSTEELNLAFSDCDILPALQSFYDEAFFKKHILCAQTIAADAESFELQQSYIANKELFVSLKGTGKTSDRIFLLCIQYGNGVVSGVTKIHFTIQ